MLQLLREKKTINQTVYSIFNLDRRKNMEKEEKKYQIQLFGYHKL